MLIRLDEYLIHQTPEPLAHPATMDRHFYDRYWLSGFPADASFYFGFGLGLYPHRQVMDAAFSLVRGGEQRACFASRRAHPAEREDTRVGPLTLQVLEPMRSLRLRLGANESGIEADLIYRARSAPVEEDRQQIKRGIATGMDVTRFTQFGCWEGELRVDGERIVVDPAQVHGLRDRSWGRRPLGEPEPGAPEPPRDVFFLWAPLLWSDEGTLAVFFEDTRGQALHAEAKAVRLHPHLAPAPALNDESQLTRLNGAAHQLRYTPGTRRAAAGELRLLQADGRVRQIQLEPMLQFQMKGAGYNHPQWRHGLWQGEARVGAERWQIAALDPLAPENLHIQQLVRCTEGERQGLGVLEQLCIGPHQTSGFTGRFDGAA